MMGAPFLVLGTIGVLIWVNVRRQRRVREQLAREETPRVSAAA